MGLSLPNYPKLSYLHALIAIADSGSFSEAALRLQLSQSAVSYAIGALENELGVVLLTRGRQGAHLTPVGEQIVDRARRITHLLDDVVKQANLAKGLEGGYVRIASFRSAASHLLPEVIAEFCRRYPAIAVRIAEYDDCPEAEEDLRRGRVDLAMTYLPPSDDIETWDLVQDDFVVLFPPDFCSPIEGIAWDDLAAYPLVMAPEGDLCDGLVYEHCAKHGVTLTPKYHVRSDATIVSMVAKGLGATISPRLAIEPTPKGVHVYALPVPLVRTIRVAILKESLLTPAAFAFLDLLKEICTRLPVERGLEGVGICAVGD
ncbi:LysR family transcriptional regulator [Leptolyngbya sp. CCNP1308]|uniref:LysR family transcriptional regulator n=1 Tax=Leptolyngbya sp. CCNP1308 TaxID=3110255 RepID=UPI002B21FD4C|nr:LysR family transcriptional regulator [Leptolyngbya sp. CCNP1308]MEA5449625.1 LysR family transcriptional regulator [Leptolyngbya sp. CCNP1308]